MTLNLSSKKAVKAIFNKYGVYPSKGLGQNFIIDKSAIKKVVKTANLTQKDLVLEVGPGLGGLTQELAKGAGRVIAVEKDPKMCAILKEILKDFSNVEIIQGDILKVEVQNLKSKIQDSKQIPNSKFPRAKRVRYGVGKIQKTYKVVANLPFYLTAPVIRKFLELIGARPLSIILIVQKEVAQRICVSSPHQKFGVGARPQKMNLLAVSVQFYAKPEIVSYISRESFWPEPKVDSAIIKIIPKKTSPSPDLVDVFFNVVKAGFSQPRKMLINNLAKKLKIKKEVIKEILQKNKISPTQRPETLTLRGWQNLTKDFPHLPC